MGDGSRYVSEGHSESGFATLFALAVVTGLVTLIAATTATAHWAAVRARASMVADLAAVAAARQGSCAAAGAVTSSYGGEVSSCTWNGVDVTIEVALPAPASLSRWSDIDAVGATARAGF